MTRPVGIPRRPVGMQRRDCENKSRDLWDNEIIKYLSMDRYRLVTACKLG